ncbi:SfnB family sulfur acquisition oxidoreductase [Aureimonas sp. ME7]|uniref:SfnB family sulfur acquisition oxidoreductase n=1 Tax=Aureimonas sp. ME7 TaxID=2744252 RepID=UPI001AEDC084|nr:SfnB family sulfur acquisition oxidoreductase [Aureimonas sp. ME7]
MDTATRPAVPVIETDADALRAAHALAQDFAGEAARRDAERHLPWDELERFVASGLWGITVPRAFGGADVSAGTLAEVIATISAADGSLGQIPQNHFYALEVLRFSGSEAQKAFFFRLALEGRRFGNALAETGTRDFSRRTRLVEKDGRLRLHGAKFYCTGALYADWIPTHALVREGDQRDTRLVFVPRHAPGVSVSDDWDGFGQRITGSGSVRFDDVAIEPEWIVPFSAVFNAPTTVGPLAQIMHAAIDLGIGRAAYADTLRFVRTRARPWIDVAIERASDDPLTLREIGETAVRLRAAEALLARAGRTVDAARDAPDEASVAAASIAVAQARILCDRAGLRAATKLFELGGASSTFAADGFDRHWRNVRTHTTHDPLRWKYQIVGRYALTGERPPRHGAI